MLQFIYKDSSKGKWVKGPKGTTFVSPVIFTVFTKSIMVADKLFHEATGIRAMVPWISTTIKR